MQFRGMTRIHRFGECEDDDDNYYEEDVGTVMMSWMKPHTQLVLRQMTQNFLNSLMAIWKTLMRLHLKCMHRQVAVFKKHVSFWLVLREPEATFLLLALVLLTAWLNHPLIASLQSLVARARRAREKGKSSSHKGGKFPNFGTLGVLQNHRPHVPSSDVQEASDRSWGNLWWTTSRSSTSS